MSHYIIISFENWKHVHYEYEWHFEKSDVKKTKIPNHNPNPKAPTTNTILMNIFAMYIYTINMHDIVKLHGIFNIGNRELHVLECLAEVHKYRLSGK